MLTFPGKCKFNTPSSIFILNIQLNNNVRNVAIRDQMIKLTNCNISKDVIWRFALVEDFYITFIMFNLVLCLVVFAKNIINYTSL